MIGLPLTVTAARLIKTQLFGVVPGDPLTLAAAVMTIFLITLLAGYLPARRASAVAPTVALRTE
jgi:ABC-type antimicrobial peptide transport system permease subunit